MKPPAYSKRPHIPCMDKTALTQMEHKVLIAVGVCVLLVVLTKLKSSAAKPKLNLPPGPWTLPLIGSIHHLVTNHGTHRALHGLAEKYGPLMHLWLGEVPTVVATSPEAAQVILKTRDLTFADRHASPTVSVAFFNGKDIAFSPYGERWRELRKICTVEMLSSARVRSFRRTREDEVASLVQSLSASAAAGAAVNLSERIIKCTNDIIVRCSVGSQCKRTDADEYLHALRTLIEQTTSLTVADLFPSSKLMQMLGTAPRKALACRKRIERIIQQIIEERKKSMEYGSNVEGEPAAGNFLDVLLRLQKEGGTATAIPITNETITVLLSDMFSAGSDTSSTTLIWIMAELIRSPRVMAKAQAEVRQAFKGKSTITEDDIIGLSYLKLVIKEGLRLHCPVPIPPRLSRETCQVMGYDIPKGTCVLVNVWAICRDPKYWEDAEEFKPERFQNSNLDYKGNNFEFLPFGSGRRMCPGANLGLANMELTLASLLYHFDWKQLSDGMEPKDVDMREAPGIVAFKRTSLHLYPVTRIAPSIA